MSKYAIRPMRQVERSNKMDRSESYNTRGLNWLFTKTAMLLLASTLIHQRMTILPRHGDQTTRKKRINKRANNNNRCRKSPSKTWRRAKAQDQQTCDASLTQGLEAIFAHDIQHITHLSDTTHNMKPKE
jgi:hypothetical protein